MDSQEHFLNSSNLNTGKNNNGDNNSGDNNSGDYNSGDYNGGNRNSGDFNFGVFNSGDWNSGSFNSGDRNSGNYNSGIQNCGDGNSGDYNIGDHNSGDWNKCNFSSGCFNTAEPKIYMFNKISDWTYSDWMHSDAHFLLSQIMDSEIKCRWLEDMTDDEKINAAFEMEKAAQKYDSRITVNSSVVASGVSTVYISNTKGLELKEKSNYLMAYVEAMAEDKGETKEKGELWIGSDIDEFNPAMIAESVAEKVISSLGGSSVESGKKKVIIKNETFADILECFCGNFYADNVQKGFSLLKDRTGEKIASDNITVVDNPLLEKGYATTAFDSEGVATYSKNIIENGVLKTYLYNLKSAAKDGTKSTGNGFKAGFKGSVNTSTTNFYIEKGSMTLEEMAESVGEGILITDVAGLHSGTNSISGDFSVAAEGFKIENGKITSPVNQITIASNFYDVPKNIEIIGCDLKFNSSAIGSPSVVVKDMSVAGL